MECKICGIECTSKTIGSHIRHKHHITAKEYFDKYLKLSGDGICICGNPTEFINISNGYRQYCSRECMMKDWSSIREKSRQTCLERYGDANYNNIEKSKQTCLERYGVEYAQSSMEVRNRIKHTWNNKTTEELEAYSRAKRLFWSEKTQEDKDRMVQKVKETKASRYNDPNYNNSEKNKQTCLDRYGVDNVFKLKEVQARITKKIIEKYGVARPAQSPEIINRMKDTSISKYGVEFFSMTDEFKKSISLSRIQNTISNNDDILGYNIINDDIYYIYRCPHPECSGCTDKFYISKAGHKKVRENQGTEVCTNILPISYERNTGTTIELFIRNILDEYSIEYITNDRSILGGKELDIYIPDRNIAIECNGIYWHSLKSKTYHYDKWKACRKKNIQLITVWEDQIINKPEIVRSIILSKMGIYKERIHARKCIVRNVTSKEASEFLVTNHLQGPVNGSIRVGLYNGDELVSLMVFGHKRKALGSGVSFNEYELYRYCNKLDTYVVGGASRLFNHFIKKYPECIVESFSSNDISTGDLYRILGFKLIGEQKRTYWYVDNEMNRHHRYKFRKDALVRRGLDSNLSESEITTGLGLFKIYDSGQQKWIFNPTS